MEDILILAMLAAIGTYALKTKEQRQRILLLGQHLGSYQIETLMERVTEGYLRALGEGDSERREQIWQLLTDPEARLSEQFSRFAASFAHVDAAQARVSTLPVAFPGAARLFPRATFDMRRALEVHAQGIARAVRNEDGRAPKDRAYTLSAELFLMQHTCHWFCRSRSVAGARMLARHRTPYAQLLQAVSPQTRDAYRAVVGR